MGGHEVDLGWTAEAFFKIMDFSFFGISLKKWTRERKTELLKAQKFRNGFHC
nr:MAG TPA: hypothetical protein [Caudoviricetes sp.]